MVGAGSGDVGEEDTNPVPTPGEGVERFCPDGMSKGSADRAGNIH
jgi:hypothetical protein